MQAGELESLIPEIKSVLMRSLTLYALGVNAMHDVQKHRYASSHAKRAEARDVEQDILQLLNKLDVKVDENNEEK